MSRERAVRRESAGIAERAVYGESTALSERAGLHESTEYCERAELEESTVSLERAAQIESTALKERAKIMKSQPVVCNWNGDNFVPDIRYKNICNRQFVVGEAYPLQTVESRNMASHNAYFAQVNEAFKNLPEDIAARWPTAEHFRKWCLVETGWHEERTFEMDNAAAATALATYIRTEDIYASIFIRGKIVIVWKAKSQSLSAMGKKDFEASKKDVIDLIASMIGVTPAKLRKEAGRSA